MSCPWKRDVDVLDVFAYLAFAGSLWVRGAGRDPMGLKRSRDRLLWDLDRFGLTPRKLWARLTNRTEPRILCVSVPKAGTHLLERALCLHPRLYRKLIPTIHDGNLVRYDGLETLLHNLKVGEIIVSHLYFDKQYQGIIKALDIRTIFIIRDPRDVVISQAYYVARSKRHYMHDLFVGKDLRERIKIAIQGYPQRGYLSTAQRLEAFSGWLDSGALVVRFEELVGVDRIESLRSIYEYLGLQVNDDFLEWLGENLISKASPTFRQGSTGHWQQVFDDELLSLFEKGVSEDMLAQYGYADR